MRQVRSEVVCDYAGYSCNCRGFKSGKTKSLCVCGHHKSQHQNSVSPSQQIPTTTILDILNTVDDTYGDGTV